MFFTKNFGIFAIEFYRKIHQKSLLNRTIVILNEAKNGEQSHAIYTYVYVSLNEEEEKEKILLLVVQHLSDRKKSISSIRTKSEIVN